MSQQPSPAERISLEHLIALSDEMAALVRAGVPLERGLLNFGQDVPGRLGRIATRLSVRLERGESVADVLAAEQESFPRVYRTVVEAGLKSGRLAVALEGLATSARRLAELRRNIGLSLLYPIVVLLLAYGLFVYLVVRLAPDIRAAYDSFRIPRRLLLDGLIDLGESAGTWGPIVPVVAAVLLALWWWQSGRALLVNSRAARYLLGWLPWVNGLLHYSRAAMFAEVFALLIEHDVPLADALRLAGETSNDPETLRAAHELAVAAERGETTSARPAALPPILHWLLSVPVQQRVLITAARHAADAYGWQARQQVELVRVMLPVVLTAVLGGVVTLLYAAALFVPWANFLNSLA